jgi:hypothetical protein
MSRRIITKRGAACPEPSTDLDDTDVMKMAALWAIDLANAGKSWHTLRVYLSAVRSYAEHSGGTLPERNTVRTWQAARSAKAASTRKTEFNALHTFCAGWSGRGSRT